jgi:hypothetical protein
MQTRLNRDIVALSSLVWRLALEGWISPPGLHGKNLIQTLLVISRS